MEPGEHQIYPQVGKEHGNKANNREDCGPLPPPAVGKPGVEKGGVDKPGDQRPGLLGVPAPVAPPGNISPGRPGDDPDGSRVRVKPGLFEPFGKALFWKPRKITNNFRLPGQYYDTETGFYYNMNRYFYPVIGRFTSSDPILGVILMQFVKLPNLNSNKDISMLSVPQLISLTQVSFENACTAISVASTFVERPQLYNPYIYVSNNPINFSDPSGLGPRSECKYYVSECLRVDGYACIAVGPCYIGLPFLPKFDNCYRNCLLDEYKAGCKTVTCQAGAHIRCYEKCKKPT